MRTEADELESVAVRLPIDEHKVGGGYEIPVIAPLSCERVIDVACCQWGVGGEKVDCLSKQRVELCPSMLDFSRR